MTKATAAVNEYFVDLPESNFKIGIELYEQHWSKYIEISEDDIEK